jgi:tetratricopeptide (TPR) repeat protein
MMRARSNFRAGLSIAALFLALLIANEAVAKDTWVRIQSKNFTLVSNASQGDARKLISKLEQFRSALSIIFPRTNLQTPVPTLVVLFKTDDDFHPFKPRVKGKIKDEVGGYFLARTHMNYVVLAVNNAALSPYEIIFHEYEHYVLHNNVNRLPVWLDEGLAEFFSSFEFSDNDRKAILGSPLVRHIYYFRQNSIVPLKTLLAVDRKSPYYNEGRKAGMFYAESWALVHYLMLGDDGKHQRQMQAFINSLAEDRPVEELFKRAFQTDLKPLEEQLQSYLNRQAFPVLKATFTDRIGVDPEITATVLPEAEVQFYLGDLLAQMNLPQEAEKRLQKSLELDATLSSSEAALGLVKYWEEQPEQAKKLLRSAIEHDPNNYLAHYYLGRLLLDENNYEDAIKAYQESIRLRPEMAFTYSGLGYAYRNAQRLDEAVTTFEQGRRRNPREEYFYRAIAYIQLERGKGESAADYAGAYLKLRGWQDEHSPYLALVKYFALRRAKRDAEAQKSLEDAAAQLAPDEWPYPVIRYLNHSLSAAELLTTAGSDNDKLTEAHAYAGLELSLNGERALALEHLHWVSANGNKNFVEYPLALAEIGRLEAAAASLR